MKDSDAEEDQEGGEISFPMPKGYTPPNSAKDGETFTALATFRVDDDDDEDNEEHGPMLVLEKVEGVPVSKDGENEEEEEGPETSPEMMNALRQPAATSASQGMPAASTY